MNIHPIIKQRCSPRAFSDKPVPTEIVLQLFEAARWSPSARNEQPWRFFYATKSDKEVYNNYFSVLNEWNQKWAHSAPVIIITVAKMNYEYMNRPNNYAIYDLGQSVAYFSLQATYLGLFVHQMGGFYPEKAIQVLGLTEGYEPITALALGYKGSIDRIPKEYHDQENKIRERLSLDSIVFHGDQKI